MSLGQRIAIIRKFRGFSPNTLAKRASEIDEQQIISQQAISALEARKSRRSKYVNPIARALDINPDYLIKGELSETGITHELRLLGSNLRAARLSAHLDPASFFKQMIALGNANFYGTEISKLTAKASTADTQTKLIKRIEAGVEPILLSSSIFTVFVELACIILKITPDVLMHGNVTVSESESDSNRYRKLFTIQQHNNEQLSSVHQLTVGSDYIQRCFPELSSVQNLALITAKGDSMQSSFDDGDILFIDKGITQITQEAIYVIQYNQQTSINRIQQQLDGGYAVLSDNSKYEPQYLSKSDSSELIVIARVLGKYNYTPL